MLIPKRLWKLVVFACLTVCVFAVGGGLRPGQTFASVYGTGGYGACNYQGCAAAPEPTQTTTTLSSGLQVSVNLTDGQTIPRAGYTVIVTPLNSATTGASIKTVAIYVDDVLVQTIGPAENGTAQWFWDPVAVPGTAIKLVVTGDDDSEVTEQFQVVIAAAGVAEPQTQNSSGASSPTITTDKGPAAPSTAQRAYNNIKHFVGTLPKPIVYGFPYALFTLLGLNIVLLLWQAARELKEHHIWQTFIQRERADEAAKLTLLQLIAHYFRTPITVLQGGIELLVGENAPVAADLKALGLRLREAVERLIAQTRQIAEPVTVGTDNAAMSAGSLLRHAGLLLPLCLVAVAITIFEYLVHAAGTLSISQVNLAVQVVVFVLLAVVMYGVYRRLQLRRRDAQESRHIYEQEQAMYRAGNELVTGVVATLRSDVMQLGQLAKQLPSSDLSAYVLNGNDRLQSLLTKLTAAEQLSNAPRSGPLVPAKLGDLLGDVKQVVADKVAERNVTLQLPEPMDFLVRSPELCAYVLQTVLDNAVSYSPSGATVQIDAQNTAQDTVITVTDKGAGIPKEKLPLLFRPFSRAEGVEVFNHEGMGFNLYLDKVIMDYLGGTIELTSEAGKGTAVALHFPLTAVASSGSASAASASAGSV